VTPADLSASVAAANPAALLPILRRGEDERLALPLSLVDAVALPTPDGAAPAWAALVRDARGTTLGVPLCRDEDADPGTGSAASVRRARPGDGAAAALLELLRGEDAPPFELVCLHDVTASGERGLRPDVDQTHESVVVGADASPDERVVVKWSVHVEAVPAAPPAVTAARHLDAVGFTEMPQPVGFLVHHCPSGERDGGQVLLASASRFLPGAQDGWDWYVDDLLGWLAGTSSDDAAVAPATAVGDLVGRMHAAFATAWSHCPAPVGRASAEDVERWRRRALDTADEAARVSSGEPGERFRRRADAARAAVTAALASAEGTRVTRVHGDLHVGQVLRWDGGYAVSDFDGNPVLPAAERDLPQPPARDVAGMLRALDHVGRIVDRRTSHVSAGRVQAWRLSVRDAFLDAYRSTVTAAGHADMLDASLLHGFEVEQECRELVYAARHLPRWAYVPDAALVELLPQPGEEGR
jgi:maltokinase